jgi:predicted transposase YbfD/YdcC
MALPVSRLLRPARTASWSWCERDFCIENRLHWRRDVTLREDHSQVRKGTAPRILAVLNSFLLALLDLVAPH